MELLNTAFTISIYTENNGTRNPVKIRTIHSNKYLRTD